MKFLSRYAILCLLTSIGVGSASGQSLTNCFCANTTDTNLCSYLPHEITPLMPAGYSGLHPQTQRTFDIFSWQSFVALNWPADSSGNPLSSQSITDPSTAGNSRVWDFYPSPDDVFGTRFSAKSSAPSAQASKTGQKFLHLIAKNVHATDFLQAGGQPIIDRNTNFALFEIKMNLVESNYITVNGLTTKAGQRAFGKKHSQVSFPAGTNELPSASNTVGALEIKATWRLLYPGLDDTNRFYTTTAIVSIPAANTVAKKELVFTNLVGLVGMHILHKTASQTNWIWSTFEHVDNAPSTPSEMTNNAVKWSFYNVNALYKVDVNAPPANTNYLWSSKAPYATNNAWNVPTVGMFGTQATRVYPIYDETAALNRIWQQKLAGSVWANYRLVGSQWAAMSDGTPPQALISAPGRLANTTLETYIQPSASCIGCHSGATIAGGKNADFSFIFFYAH